MADTALLQMCGIDKSFAGAPALSQVDLTVAPGEVRALIGQNGAGKSTLIKVLTGVHRRDGGRIEFAGREVDFTSTQDAQRSGVATIYQEVNLIPYRSVAENVCVGRAPRRFGLLDWKAINADARTRLAALDVHVDVTRPLYEYPIATQQMTAIARALAFDARLVVMDEPTSSLAEREVGILLDVIRRLRDAGVAVVFVSHRLDELYAVCDTITVLRDGQVVADTTIADLPKYELVSTMLGRELTESERRGQHVGRVRGESAPTVLEAHELRRPPALNGSSVELRRGEVVGLAGLLGSGRSETARALFGADPISDGELRRSGRSVSFSAPRDAIRARIGFCSEDRKAEGIIPELSVRENLTLALLPRLVRRGIVDRSRQQQIVQSFIDRLGIKLSNPDQKISELSGGNQQKVLLARWLCTDPEVLILDEPTRGIDVGAKQDIRDLIGELADEGMSVLLISSELEELITGCDRVLVLRDGTTVAEFDGSDISERSILHAMAEGAAAGDREERTTDG
ncbi:sugar ABC transporter ATP-binding protein [Pseudonocardia nigra]|uniref:sugar ABC transporter ATP-binding protein n=1 Tax=Pseudonocardia nigra TaxID=1921578 RepID=UPI001C5CC4B4|nr:sugar ABC transporter ATP-binding protein [Pseudonocardia nigra]